jgi:hypothetical protein
MRDVTGDADTSRPASASAHGSRFMFHANSSRAAKVAAGGLDAMRLTSLTWHRR